jgi:membrane dipeptidase
MLLRRHVLQLGLVSLAACVRRARTLPSDPKATYRRAIVIDAVSSFNGDPDETDPAATLWQRGLDDCLASGLTAIHLTIAAGGSTWRDTEEAAAWLDREIDARPDVFLRVRSADDLQVAKDSGRLGLISATQSLDMIRFDLDRLDALHARGIRIAQPTYNLQSALGSGCLAPDDTGLTELGREAIARMIRAGITVDLSHASRRTQADGIAEATGPVAISHTGCAALHPHPRNTGDDELRACADKGGVIGIYFMPFLRAAGQPTTDDVVRHLEHVIDVAGEDHVGIGTDGGISLEVVDDAYRKSFREFIQARKKAGIAAPGEDEDTFMFVEDLNGPRKLETLAERLSARGHADARIEKILGANFVRLYRDTWR